MWRFGGGSALESTISLRESSNLTVLQGAIAAAVEGLLEHRLAEAETHGIDPGQATGNPIEFGEIIALHLVKLWVIDIQLATGNGTYLFNPWIGETRLEHTKSGDSCWAEDYDCFMRSVPDIADSSFDRFHFRLVGLPTHSPITPGFCGARHSRDDTVDFDHLL